MRPIHLRDVLLIHRRRSPVKQSETITVFAENRERKRKTRRWLILELEGDLDAGAVGGDFPVVDRHVQLEHFGNSEIAERSARALDCIFRGLLPAFVGGSDEFDDLVDAT